MFVGCGRRARFLLLALAVGACHDAAVERGKSEGTNGGDRYVDPCGALPSERALAWDEASVVGVTPAMAFGAANGECKTTLRWSGAPAADLASQPPNPETPLTVSVSFDPQSARIIGDDPTLAAGGCVPRLHASATVRLASEDGLLRAEQQVTGSYTGVTGPSSFQISVPLTGDMPGLAIALGPNERASLSISFDGAASACAGEVFLVRESTAADGHSGSDSEGRLAEWSNSGCPLGQSAVDLTALDGTGRPSIAALVAQRFASMTLHGAWSDGANSDLTVSTSLSSTSACAEGRGPRTVIAPARVTYATSDGRVGAHAAAASLRIDGDGQRRFQLYVDETLTCTSESAALSYTPVDCSRLDHVMLQLALQAVEGADGFDLASSRLEAYEYLRGSRAAAGTADAVRTFQSSMSP